MTQASDKSQAILKFAHLVTITLTVKRFLQLRPLIKKKGGSRES